MLNICFSLTFSRYDLQARLSKTLLMLILSVNWKITTSQAAISTVVYYNKKIKMCNCVNNIHSNFPSCNIKMIGGSMNYIFVFNSLSLNASTLCPVLQKENNLWFWNHFIKLNMVWHMWEVGQNHVGGKQEKLSQGRAHKNSYCFCVYEQFTNHHN